MTPPAPSAPPATAPPRAVLRAERSSAGRYCRSRKAKYIDPAPSAPPAAATTPMPVAALPPPIVLRPDIRLGALLAGVVPTPAITSTPTLGATVALPNRPAPDQTLSICALWCPPVTHHVTKCSQLFENR